MACWGIIGCGQIATAFATALSQVPGACLRGVAARELSRAADFAKRFSAQQSYGDYASLFADPQIDIVYIATPHHNHAALSLQAIAAGKAVLCEKPVALNAADWDRVTAAAEQAQVFVMEAMWTRFMPAVQELQAQLDAGLIGPVQLIQADFGIHNDWDPRGRMLNPELGGGALLDLGIYPLTFASILFRAQPVSLHGFMKPAVETGVDEFSSYHADYGDGRFAQLMSACRLKVPHQARIYGTRGRVIVDDFFHPQGFTVERHGQAPKTVKRPFQSTGYQFEAVEAQRCLAKGLTESPTCPWSSTRAILSSMDQLRRQWGLRYPDENP
jgi:predicted dehydrogenase